MATAYSQTLQATGGTAPRAWSVTGGSVPAGLALSNGGVLSGTPTTAGSSNFTVQVKDASSPAQTASASFALTIAASVLPVTITTGSPLPSGTVGTAYSQTLQASGGAGPYTWSVTGGSLPGGLALSSGGVLSGTPTTAGTSNFTVQVKDASSPAQTASASFALTIAVLPVTIITGSPLPSGAVGTAYNQTFVAAGGTAPYTWSIISGNKPAGLTLNPGGVLSGTPTNSGMSNFTVQVTDSSSPVQTASMPFVLTINTAAAACNFNSGTGPKNANGNLAGNYVYLFKGFDGSGNAVARVGSFNANPGSSVSVGGSGSISAGYEDVAIGGGAGSFTNGPLASSTYCIDLNGQGDITIGSVNYRLTALQVIGGSPDPDVSFIEFDPVDGVRGSGVMKFQGATSITQPAGQNITYVFGLSGRDESAGNVPAAVIGAFSMDSTLSAAPALYGNNGEEDFYDSTANGAVNPTLNSTISVSLTSPPNANGRYSGTLTAAHTAGNINFAAYVVSAANSVPVSNNATELFVISTGTPAGTILSGQILSQNFAANASFSNSAIKGTPDARALIAPSTVFYVVGEDPNSSASIPSPQSAAGMGVIGFNGNGGLPGPTGKIATIEMDTDVGGTVTGPMTAFLPANSTYTVAPDGRTTLSTSAAPVPGLAYLSDVDMGFVLDITAAIATAGFGRMITDASAPNVPPEQAGFLIGDVAAAVGNSATTVGLGKTVTVSASGGTLNWTLDVDDPFTAPANNLKKGVSSPSPLAFTATDQLGRFTVGICPPSAHVPDVCLVGYSSASHFGAIVIDETNTGPTLIPAWPAITIWGFVP